MSVHISPGPNNFWIIQISGRFDYNAHGAFRQAYSDGQPRAGFIVDLTHVQYIDSAALGMLLVLREHVADDPHRVIIKGAQGQPLEVLMVAHFERLFDLQ